MLRVFCAACALLVVGCPASAQGTSSIDLTAQVTPTGGRPEPVRQFTFYLLTKSYPDIIKEVEAEDAIPTREQFLSKMKASPQLRDWMKAHDVIDLAAPDIDQLITPDNVMDIPEFFAAYVRANSGGVTHGLPRPKFRESDKEKDTAKYDKLHEEYLVTMRKFIQSNPATISGIELELAGVNPKNQWDKIVNDHRNKIAQLAPDTAQTKYLAGKAETDLDGRATISGLPAGSYWISSLGLDASSGDRRLRWDVPVKVPAAGLTVRVALTNLNGSDAHKPIAP